MSTSDLDILEAFFASIDRPDLLALPPSSGRITQSAGHEDAHDLAWRRGLAAGSYSYVFWHRQSHERAFDARGWLIDTLWLHWGGSYEVVHEALRGLPAPLELIASGPESAFQVRRPLEEAPLQDEAAVRAKLRTVHDSADEQTGAWLHQALSEAPRSCALEVLAALARTGELRDEELRGAPLEELVKVAAERDPYTLERTVAEILRAMATRDPERAGALRAAWREHKHRVFRAALALALEHDPDEGALQDLRALLSDREDWVASCALRSLVAARARREGQADWSIALALAQDPSVTDVPRSRALEHAATSLGWARAREGMGEERLEPRLDGALALAERPALETALREAALGLALDGLRFQGTSGAVARAEALIAQGLEAEEQLLMQVRQRQWP